MNPNRHAIAVDMADLQVDRLLHAQASRVRCHQDHSLLEIVSRVEQCFHFGVRKDHRQLLFSFGTWDLVDLPRAIQHFGVKELQAGISDVDPVG